ncbi:MAG: hypothetical protein PHU54_05410 [Candidatus Omnitrophica bacterium]|nr:hypothetical protein [Candidatus Omnitrophota bacterium]
MPCCGMGAFNETAAGAWIRCLTSAMGLSGFTSWGRKPHAKLWELAVEVREALERDYPALAPIRDPGFGVDTTRTAQLASVIAKVHPTVRDAFWPCTTLEEQTATAQMAAQSGSYWDALMSALAVIHHSEQGPTAAQSSNDGPAAVAALVIGCIGTMVGLAR